ncbi:putative ribonuclease H-like domain-containing protein [Tanacetum coccineum]
MRSSMLKQNFSELKLGEAEDCTKVQAISAFVSTTSASKKMSYADSPSYTSSTYTVPSNSKTGSHRSGNVIEDVLQSFVADTEPEQQLAIKILIDRKNWIWRSGLKLANGYAFCRVHSLSRKAGRMIDFDKKESAKDHDGQSDGVIASKEFGMIAGCDTEDEIEKGAAKIYNLITGADKKEVSTAGDTGEFALMGVTSESPSNDFASSDSSVKSSEPKSNDSTFCASTSSISTSESEAEIESNVILGKMLHLSLSYVLCIWQNRPIPVPTNRGDSSSVTSGWWQSTAIPMPYLNRPTSSYFQTYTPYVPQMYYNHTLYGGVRWATAVKPSAGCSWKTHRKGLYWENTYTDAEDEGIFDSGCSRRTATFHIVLQLSDCDKKNRVLFTDTVVLIQFILNPLGVCDHLNSCVSLGMFDGKLDEATCWDTLKGLSHEWYFDLNYLTDTLGYKRDKANQSTGTHEDSPNPAEAEPKDISSDEVDDSPLDSAEEIFQKEPARLKGQEQRATSVAKDTKELQKRASTKLVPPCSIVVPTSSIQIPSGDTTISPGGVPFPTDLGNNEPLLGIFSSSSYDDKFGADLNNLASTVEVSPVATKRINTIHPQSLIIGDHTSAMQTRSKVNKTTIGESAFISYIHDQQRNNHIDFQHCLFACFLSQVEPRSVAQALEDPSWVDAMQEEMQQFKFQNVWVLVDLPEAQGHRHEEGIDYDEVFAPVARIEAIGLFLAFASYLGFMVYQMDVKSSFKALYWTSQAPRSWIHDRFTNYLSSLRLDISCRSVLVPRIMSSTYFNLEVVKKIFKYLKGQPKLGLWYPRESPFVLEAYSDSDYAGANKDRKSTTSGCQFLGRRLISWQCKKQIIMATSSTEAEYVAAANCCGQSSMAALRYRDEHNKVGYLQKPKGSDDYHQILDFLGASHIRYALTHDPIIFDSLVKQFWSTATLRSPELGPPAILATIDKTPYTITEESVRSQLQLVDDGGIDDLPIVEIYSGMDNLGYVTEGKLTFFKNKFSPQWRFLVHTLLHCLSTKSGSWDQFGSSIVVALICLSDGRRFNWSSYIFKGMVSNIGNAKKFLMYPRFLQAILGIETSITRQYHVFKLSSKLFANMKLNFVGQTLSLLDVMLTQAQEDHVSTPTRLQATPHVAPVFEHAQQTEPNIASSSRIHDTEDDSLGGSFHVSPLRFTQASPTGHASGGAEDHITLSALSFAVSTLIKKVHSLETELKAHKKLFKDVVSKLVKKVKALEVKLKTKKRKVVLSDSDQKDRGEPVVDLEALIALANAAVTVDSTKSPGGPSKNHAACSYDPTSDVPSTDVPTTEVPFTDVPTDVPSGVAPTGPSTVSPGSTTVPTSSSVPAAETIPARSGITTATPLSPVRDARKGKGVVIEDPTPTQDKTFKQLEEERLGWEAAQRLQAQELADLEKQRAESLMKDANLARQMAQDFELTEDQRKRQQEVLASAANYSDATWDIILARLQANPDLSSIIFGVDFTDNDFAAKMVDLVTSRRKELAEQRAKERRDRPMTPAQLRQYMRTYVKNQGPAVYSTGWTMAQVRKLSPEQLQEEFDKIQRVVAFTRGLKRDGSPMSTTSSKKHKTGDVEVDVEAPSHGVSQDVEVEAPSQDVSREKVDAPSHSQTIPEVQTEVPSQDATVDDVEKGIHTSHSTILIEEGDPDVEHKLCIKYASDEASASDYDTPVHLYVVVDWELLPTGLGSINAIYRLDNSRKYFTSLREILHLVTRADLMTIYGRVMTFYQDKKAEGVGLVLSGDLQILVDSPEVNDGSAFWKNQHTWSIQSWKLYSFSGVHVLETVSGLVIHMFVDKKYPLYVNLIERMLDYQLEICHETVGNELTTAVQLISFLKKQISDSKRPKVHEWYC